MAVLLVIARQLVWRGNGVYVRLGRVLAGNELPGALYLLRRCAAGAVLGFARDAPTTKFIHNQQSDGVDVLICRAVDYVYFRQLRYR
ncbi:hypothetical protein D3C78_1278030 [compost metagenome]